MAGFSVKKFTGLIPRVGPRFLPVNGAQIANNVKLYSGELRAWMQPLLINTPSKGGTSTSALISMYRIFSTGTIAASTATDAWLTWTDDVDVARGSIAGDTAFKIYYTGDSTGIGGPKKTNLSLATGASDFPHDYLEMGVPAPGSAPSVIGTGGTSTVNVTRVYAYTYVTNTASWAEESGPSAPGTGTGKYDSTWVISGLSTGTTGKYAFTGGIKRIYRTLTDNSGNTNYNLALDNVPMATTSTNDTVADANLGAVCPTFLNGVVGSSFDPPPADLKGIVALPNGILAGFSGNKICFCEPFLPYAWPVRYQLATNFPIVSLGVYGNTLIVTTQGTPYAVTGVRPDAMSMSMIEENHPCTSKRSTVSFPFGVMWSTPDGLIVAGVGGVENLTDPYMKRAEYNRPSWQNLCWPSVLIGHRYMDAYIGFFNIPVSDGNSGNFVFDKTNPSAAFALGNQIASGVWTDPTTSFMYILKNNQIFQWDADSNNQLSYDWKSKTFVLPRPVNFGAIQVDADYSQINNSLQIATQSASDKATNLTILGTGQYDTVNVSAWAATSSYGTGVVVKSSDGIKKIACIVSGTSSSVEPTYPSILGGTTTDGTVQWVRVWEQSGVTKGSLRGAVLRDHVQYISSDPPIDGVAGNQWGFPLRGSLLVGGLYPNINPATLILSVYAVIDASTTATGENTVLVNQQNLADNLPLRLPKGFKSYAWEFRLTGNITVRYFKVAETVQELATVSAEDTLTSQYGSIVA